MHRSLLLELYEEKSARSIDVTYAVVTEIPERIRLAYANTPKSKVGFPSCLW